MSGRGRSHGRGSGRGNSRASGRGLTQNNNKNNNGKPKAEEMQFTPYYTEKQQGATYDTVRDYIVQHIQKNYKFGNDIAVAIDEDKDFAN